ncbi:MAG: SH3 domain-containing protein, partial [Verrucomicrobiota bacterium]
HRDARLSPENFAIITSEETSAVTAPTPGAKSVIALPPGSEVRILQDAGAWNYVNIPGGLRGWIRASDVEKIWPL